MSKQKRLTKEAFSEIYLEHYDDMKRFAAKRFFAAGRTDPHQVLDAVQETFRILCEKPESYQNSPSPSGWLYVTLTYVIQNQLRQENRQTKLLAKAQDAWAEEVQPPPGAQSKWALQKRPWLSVWLGSRRSFGKIIEKVRKNLQRTGHKRPLPDMIK